MRDQDHLFTADQSVRIAGAQSPLLLVWGSSGGVGSTMSALTLGEIAAGAGRINKVVVVDACREKGDVRTVLRMGAKAPSLTTAVVSNRVTDSIIPAEMTNGFRPETVPDVSFGTVIAPEYTQVSDTPITNQFLLRTIHQLRLYSDLVIVDCGSLPFSTDEESQLFLVGQLMQEGAYSVGICESTMGSVRNLAYLVTLLQNDFGIGREKLMIMMNKRRQAFSLDQQWASMRTDISTVTYPLDPVAYDEENIADVFTRGFLPTAHPELSSSLANALRRVTGNEVFTPIAEANTLEARLAAGKKKTPANAATGATEASAARRIPSFGRRK